MRIMTISMNHQFYIGRNCDIDKKGTLSRNFYQNTNISLKMYKSLSLFLAIQYLVSNVFNLILTGHLSFSGNTNWVYANMHPWSKHDYR